MSFAKKIFPLLHIHKIIYFPSLKLFLLSTLLPCPFIFFIFISFGGGAGGCLGTLRTIFSLISSLFKTHNWELQSGRPDRCSAATMSSALRRVGAQQKHSVRSCQLPRDNSSVSAFTPFSPAHATSHYWPHHCTTFAPLPPLSLFPALSGT